MYEVCEGVIMCCCLYQVDCALELLELGIERGVKVRVCYTDISSPVPDSIPYSTGSSGVPP